MTGVTAMTAVTDIGSSTPMLATMIGLAVGIDYTLFILARYRAELHHTDDRRHAAGIAVGTAGSAVVFAGLTVLIALSALSIVRIPFLTAMGLAAAATVLIAVLVALTLLPAILGMLKSWTFRGRIRRDRVKRDEQGLIINNGVRWGRLIGRAPIAFVAVIVIGLGALALPIGQMYLAFPTDSTAPSDTTQRQASDLMTEAFGPGREGPLLVVVDGRDISGNDARQAAFDDVAAWAAGQDDVQDATLVATNEAGTGAMIQVTPESGPDDPATLDLLQALRDGQSDIESATGTTTGVTGLTAITTDVSDRLTSALPTYLIVVVGLAFILLMLVFRSILVPLTATLGFLLSVLATLGATVAVFQEGALGIFEGQPIVSFMPIFLIGMVFGLAMDYQVFLVTRMREAHVHGLSTREAVVDGFRNSARVVVAAATIMIAVFSGFMLEDDAVVKSMGFALAASILFDAFIVRMALIPAVLYLLGEKAWWLPKWLDRLLPNVDVEGTSLERDSIPTVVTDDLDKELETAGVYGGGEGRLDVGADLAGLGGRPVAVEYQAVTTDQELGEVPLDHAAEHAALLALEPLVQRVGVLAVDLDLGEHGERDAVLLLAEGGDLVLGAGLLPAELVAREPEDGEALVGIAVVDPLEAGVLRGEAALRCGVHHQHDRTFVRRKVDRRAVDVRGLEVVERRHSASVANGS